MRQQTRRRPIRFVEAVAHTPRHVVGHGHGHGRGRGRGRGRGIADHAHAAPARAAMAVAIALIMLLTTTSTAGMLRRTCDRTCHLGLIARNALHMRGARLDPDFDPGPSIGLGLGPDRSRGRRHDAITTTIGATPRRVSAANSRMGIAIGTAVADARDVDKMGVVPVWSRTTKASSNTPRPSINLTCLTQSVRRLVSRQPRPCRRLRRLRPRPPAATNARLCRCSATATCSAPQSRCTTR